jgi:hypothetical protein
MVSASHNKLGPQHHFQRMHPTSVNCCSNTVCSIALKMQSLVARHSHTIALAESL